MAAANAVSVDQPRSPLAGGKFMCERCGIRPRLSSRRHRCSECDPLCHQCDVATRVGGSHYCNHCQAERRRDWYKNDPANRAQRLASNKAGNDALRQETLDAYGGICACKGCQETLPQFLTVDHMNNDGASHRRSVQRFGGIEFYRHLRTLGFPQEDYQLLCWNCNLGKHIYGHCPHLDNP